MENIIRDLYLDFSDLAMNHESISVSSHEVHEEEPVKCGSKLQSIGGGNPDRGWQ